MCIRDSHVGMSREGEALLAGQRVPDLHRLVITGAGQAFAVRAEADALDRALVPLEGGEALLAGQRVPDLHRPVLTPGGQAFAVRTEADAADPKKVVPNRTV